MFTEETMVMGEQAVAKYRKCYMGKLSEDGAEWIEHLDECVLYGTAFDKTIGMQYNEKYTHPINCNQLVIGKEEDAEECFIRPNLLNGNSSAVITVPDNESVRKLIVDCKNKGIRTHIIDFAHSSESSHYNPFLHLESARKFNLQTWAEILSDMIKACMKSRSTNDPFWEKSEKTILRILVLYILQKDETDEDRSFSGLLKAFQKVVDIIKRAEDSTGGLSETCCKDILEKFDCSEGKKWSESLKFVHEKTFRNILMCNIVDLQIFSTPIKNCFEEKPFEDNIDMKKFGTEQHYLFIIGSDTKTVSGVAGLLVADLFGSLLAFSETRGDINLPCHVHFYLDCFNEMYIPNYLTMQAIIRKYNINFSVITENIEQLAKKFTNEEWRCIPSCSSTVLYLGVPEELDETTKNFLLEFCKEEKSMTDIAVRMKTKSFKSGNEIIAFIDDKPPVICDKL